MKNEFSLNLAVSINTKEQIIDFNWTSCSNKILGIEIQPPADISQTVNICLLCIASSRLSIPYIQFKTDH